ncbi:hypothetical protein TNCV_2452661 [Trichonephila clavipes]|nr:hypothetical protein TNCV_2452661 [Trichonephila clavipes]
MAEKDILVLVQSSKNIIDADFDDENKMNNAAPVPSSSEMMNIMVLCSMQFVERACSASFILQAVTTL